MFAFATPSADAEHQGLLLIAAFNAEMR